MLKISEAEAKKLTILNQMHRNMWRPDIINLLIEQDRPLRFSELQKRLKISQKVLTSNLRWLEAHGFIHRHVFPEVPPRVEYSLTEISRQLAPVHAAMREWANYYVTHTDSDPD